MADEKDINILFVTQGNRRVRWAEELSDRYGITTWLTRDLEPRDPPDTDDITHPDVMSAVNDTREMDTPLDAILFDFRFMPREYNRPQWLEAIGNFLAENFEPGGKDQGTTQICLHSLARSAEADMDVQGFCNKTGLSVCIVPDISHDMNRMAEIVEGISEDRIKPRYSPQKEIERPEVDGNYNILLVSRRPDLREIQSNLNRSGITTYTTPHLVPHPVEPGKYTHDNVMSALTNEAPNPPIDLVILDLDTMPRSRGSGRSSTEKRIMKIEDLEAMIINEVSKLGEGQKIPQFAIASLVPTVEQKADLQGVADRTGVSIQVLNNPGNSINHFIDEVTKTIDYGNTKYRPSSNRRPGTSGTIDEADGPDRGQRRG